MGDLAGVVESGEQTVIAQIARCTAMFVPVINRTSWCAHQWFDMLCPNLIMLDIIHCGSGHDNCIHQKAVVILIDVFSFCSRAPQQTLAY